MIFRRTDLYGVHDPTIFSSHCFVTDSGRSTNAGPVPLSVCSVLCPSLRSVMRQYLNVCSGLERYPFSRCRSVFSVPLQSGLSPELGFPRRDKRRPYGVRDVIVNNVCGFFLKFRLQLLSFPIYLFIYSLTYLLLCSYRF